MDRRCRARYDAIVKSVKLSSHSDPARRASDAAALLRVMRQTGDAELIRSAERVLGPLAAQRTQGA